MSSPAPAPTVSSLNCLNVHDTPIFDSPSMEGKRPLTPGVVAFLGTALALVGAGIVVTRRQ